MKAVRIGFAPTTTLNNYEPSSRQKILQICFLAFDRLDSYPIEPGCLRLRKPEVVDSGQKQAILSMRGVQFD
jgi:hypothetical protein